MKIGDIISLELFNGQTVIGVIKTIKDNYVILNHTNVASPVDEVCIRACNVKRVIVPLEKEKTDMKEENQTMRLVYEDSQGNKVDKEQPISEPLPTDYRGTLIIGM